MQQKETNKRRILPNSMQQGRELKTLLQRKLPVWAQHTVQT